MPLPREKKEELMKDVRTAFRVIKKELSQEEVDRILNDPEKDRIHELGVKFKALRDSYDTFRVAVHYPEYHVQGFARLLPVYLDMSGTAEADAKNRELLSSLATEEGRKKFARTAAEEILNVDMSLLLPSGDVEKDMNTYAEHVRELELCWAAQDLLNDGQAYLEPEVYNLFKDRMPMLQSAGQYYSAAKLAASDLYTVMPKITPAEREKLLDVESLPGGDDLDPYLIADLDEYSTNLRIVQDFPNDKTGKVMQKAIEMEEKGKLTPFTIAVNEQGQRMKLSDGIAASLEGKKITFKENTADRPAIEPYINKARLQIQLPKQKDTSLYDSFSKDALSAQGKGLLAEFARLEKVMDDAKLWYTSGSHEFKETDRLLKKYASGEIPTKEQAIEKMDEILKLCNKYIKDKPADEDELKPRVQKRLRAMKEVRDSLQFRRDLLKTTMSRGRDRHWEAAENAGLMETPFHVSTENQQLFHIAESDRQAALYRKEIIRYKGADEKTAMGRLAADVEETITKLSYDSVSDTVTDKTINPRPQIVLSESRYELAKELAKMALLQAMHEDRLQAPKNGRQAVKGELEIMLDQQAKDDDAWDKVLKNIAKSETVKKLTDEIIESSKASAAFFENNGPHKLAADLKKEMKDVLKASEKKEKKEEKKIEKKADKKIQKEMLRK